MAARAEPAEPVDRPPSLIALHGAEGTAERPVDALNAPRCRLESRRFPDGESSLRVLDDVAECELIVGASLRDPDPQLPSLLFLADALHELGAVRVGLVAPYLPYMRQDARFHPGEAALAQAVTALRGVWRRGFCRNSAMSLSKATRPTPIRKPVSRTGSLQTRLGL